MVDSGSTLHGMNIAKELPGYESLVVPLPDHKKGAGAETASGDKMPINAIAPFYALVLKDNTNCNSEPAYLRCRDLPQIIIRKFERHTSTPPTGTF